MARKPLRHIFALFGLALLLAALNAPVARGADARMSRAESQIVAAQLLDGVLVTHNFTPVCTSNVVVSFADSGQTLVGVGLAQQAFDQIMKINNASEAKVESLIVGEGNASAEIAMTGKVFDQDDEIVDPGRVVRTTYSVFIDMNGGKVTALHIYGIDQVLDLTTPSSTDSYYPVQTFPGQPY